MIDWGAVATTGIWLLGLAVMLIVASFREYARWGAMKHENVMPSVCPELVEGSAEASLADSSRPFGGPQGDREGYFRIRKRAGGALPLAAEWLSRWELLWLGLLTPFFWFLKPGWAIILLALPMLWWARWLARGRFVPRTPVDWPMVLLLLMVLVSVLVTPDLPFSLGKVSGVLLGVELYYGLIEWISNWQRLRSVVYGYLLVGGGLALIGLLGTNWLHKLPGLMVVSAHLPAVLHGLPGAEKGFQPNEVAGALLWVAPLSLSLLISMWTGKDPWSIVHGPSSLWIQRLGLLVLSLVSLAVLLLTQSRSALAGLAPGVGLLLWLVWPRLRPAFVLVVVIGVVGTIVVGPAQIAEMLIHAPEPGESTTNGLHQAQGRLEIWSRAVDAIGDFPLTGMGMNSFRRVMPVLYPLFSFRREADAQSLDTHETAPGLDSDIGHAHNQFLQAALDLGLPGLVAYLALWLGAAAIAASAWRQASDGWTRSIVAGLAAALAASFVYGLTDAVALGARPGVLWWGILGLIVTVNRSLPRDEQSLYPEPPPPISTLS